MYEIVFEPSDLNMLAAIGIIEKAKLFPYLLSMGDLRHPCDSCYRCEQFIKCLSEYCTDCKSQAKKLWEKYHTTEDIIQDAMMNQKSLRIWVRNTSECWCGIYYICFCAAKRHSANISLASTEDLKKVLEFKGDQISEKTLSSEDIAEYAQKWEKLLRENKPIALTLKNAGFYVSVVNAMLIHDFSDNSIRKLKTDRADSLKIANYALTFWNQLPPYTSKIA